VSEDRRRKLSTISGVSEGDIPGSDCNVQLKQMPG
jgi:hypothetical protein